LAEEKRTRRPVDPFWVGRIQKVNPEKPHSLSPSSWNNYSACPRKFWLSRRRLPRKTGMAAALGTAVHEALEAILLLDTSSLDPSLTGWLPDAANSMLDSTWEEEKARFFSTPRHPAWKEEHLPKARGLLESSIQIVLERSGQGRTKLEDIPVRMWGWVQSMMAAVEGELRSPDGKLMGRMDAMMYEIDASGSVCGWIVADLKTGRPPSGEISENISRQLRMYRDLLDLINPEHPPISSEAWYPAGPKVITAHGPNIIEEALLAWEGMRPRPDPPEATPSEDACGFCEWKGWCPSWLPFRQREPPMGAFSDLVIHLERYEEETGAAVLESCAAVDEDGGLAATGQRMGAYFEGIAKDRLEEILSAGWKGPLVCASSLTRDRTVRIGDWCDIIPYIPITSVIEGRLEDAPEMKD